jgi:hypothetical protein
MTSAGLVRAIYQAAAVCFGSSIETRSLPISLAATHRGFTFYVAFPKNSIPSLRDVFYLASSFSWV